jgi:hypothetical protein
LDKIEKEVARRGKRLKPTRGNNWRLVKESEDSYCHVCGKSTPHTFDVKGFAKKACADCAQEHEFDVAHEKGNHDKYTPGCPTCKSDYSEQVAEELDPLCPEVIKNHKRIWCGPGKDTDRHKREVAFEDPHMKSCKRCQSYKKNESLTTTDDGIGMGGVSGGSPLDNATSTRRGQNERSLKKSSTKESAVTTATQGSSGVNNQGTVGYVEVPGGPIDTNEKSRRYLSVRQVSDGIVEIAFDGVRSRHATRMLTEALRFRLLGYGGPFLQLVDSIVEWITQEAFIGQEYVLDVMTGRKFILDDQGFLSHLGNEHGEFI